MKNLNDDTGLARGPDARQEPLSSLLGRPMEPGHFLTLAAQIAAALAEFHAEGNIHKHLSPHCIFIDPETNKAIITGSPAAASPSYEYASDETLCKREIPPAYMSPEQTGRMNRPVDRRTDFYTLGVIFYEMLTGRVVFEGHDIVEWVHFHLARLPVPPKTVVPEILPALSEIVMKLLSKDAEDRYQTASGLKRDLEKCLRQWEASQKIEPFALGAEDISDRLLIPQRLYGRNRELAALQEAFKRVIETGTPEVIMVAGYSGIGKTALIRELYKTVLGARGYFVSGKFDPHKRTIPYPVLPEIFRELSQQILSESEERVARWELRIQEAVGKNGQLLVDVIPELALIIGPQPPVPEPPPAESRNRFTMVFRQFVSVFLRKEHPLVVFLDDLQWIDAPGLQLLTHIITQPETKHLLLIGAYRDNEVGPSHPLLSAMEDIRKSTTSLQTIPLSSLSMEALSHFLSDTLHADQPQVEPLTRLVHEKTGGNPFFVIQFVMTLSDEGLVHFDREERRWRWDIDRIREKGYTDNVADLMAGKLRKLTERTVQEVRLAACLGNRFDLRTLASISSISEEETGKSLAEAVEEGLLLRRNGEYSFLHDRIQEAAYSLVPEQDRAGLHLRIGRLLLADMPNGQLEESIFHIANHFSYGLELISDREERRRVAALDLRAGRKAKASAAYTSACTFLAAGAALLGEEGWERDYELAINLCLERAECEYLTGSFTNAESLLDQALLRAKTRAEKAAAYRLRIELFTVKGEVEKAVDTLIECAAMFGHTLEHHPPERVVKEQYARVMETLAGRSIEELILLPRVADRDVHAFGEALMAASPPAANYDDRLHFRVIAEAVHLSIQHGSAPSSSAAYTHFGTIIGPLLGEYRDGYRYGKLGYDLALRDNLAAYKARSCAMFAYGIIPWTRHVSTALPYLKEGLRAGAESGDLIFACFCCACIVSVLLAGGVTLAEADREAAHMLAFVQSAKFGDVEDVLLLQRRFILRLRGIASPPVSIGDGLPVDDELDMRIRGRFPTAVCWYHVRTLQERFLFEDYRGALSAGIQAKDFLWTASHHWESCEHSYFVALTLAALYAEASSPEREEYLFTIRAEEERYRVWAGNCPDNFGNRYALIMAERARIEGRDQEAMRLYEQAIKSARDNGFVQNEALASEIAARFYLGLGFEKIASTYLREARSCYLRWEADGKVRQLDQRYPWLREEVRTAAARIGQVDAITVVKGTQAISGEILLSNLLDRLMKIVLENGGAQKGCLLLTRGDDLVIEAQARVEGEEIKVLQEVSLPLPSVLPLSIINYVRRTRQMVILDDACVRNMFSPDEYIAENKPVSVLCLPVLRQAHLAGLLYLENDLVRGAFTANRIEVLEVLAAQAAISLENSTLYASLQKAHEELEQRVAARTKELSLANAKLQELDRLKSMFIASMSHELRTPLNSVIGFSSLLLEEWFGSLNAEQKENLAIVLRSGKHLLSLINDVIDVSKIEAGKVETMVEKFDVYDIVSEAVTTLTKDIRDKGLALEVDVPHYRMRTDSRRLLQCVLNLVGNAVKFTEKGGIHVVARQLQGSRPEDVEPGTLDIEPGENFLEIFVEDTGIGIKEEDLPKLFNSFARIESPIKAPGTGLGLYLTKKLTTELLKGKISCRSRYGEGSRFTLRMPVKI